MRRLEPTQIAEDILGSIEWIEGSKGYCACPGRAKHTTPDARRDCRVCLDGAPTIHCVHSSCEVQRAEVNRQLRSVIGRAFPGARSSGASRPKSLDDSLRRRSAASLPGILDTLHFPVDGFADSSPEQVPQDGLAQQRLLLSLFRPDDVIWIGDRYDSGSEHHRSHFRTAAEWGAAPLATGPLIVPNAFKPDVHARSTRNVQTLCYLVVESDELGKEEVIAVFRWLAQLLRLRAVVDAAGKSLHGWFDYPELKQLEELKVILPALKCDRKMFGTSQPCRLPGALRPDKGNKPQRLLWLDRGGAQ